MSAEGEGLSRMPPLGRSIGGEGYEGDQMPSFQEERPEFELGGKEAWEILHDTLFVTHDVVGMIAELPTAGDLTTGLPLAMDLVELDAERRQRTIAFVDSDTRKLKRAYLHVPSWRNKPPIYHNAKELAEAIAFMKHGFALSRRVPIETEVHYYPYGYHLALDEMKAYTVLLLRYIGEASQSLSDVAQYLIGGGYAVVEYRSTLSILQRELRKTGSEVRESTLELGHPIFHTFFDIARYYSANGPCPSIGPTPALEVDRRVVAVVSPIFIWEHDCHSNDYWVNILSLGLTQPSSMGGRYLIKRKQ
jgi:hypothetical protein